MDLRLAVSTQTPLVRFRERSAKDAGAGSLDDLIEGEHYVRTTGGVVRMLLPLLREWRASGFVRDAAWVAMGDEHAPALTHQGVGLRFVALSEGERHGYALVKERMWDLLNSTPSAPARSCQETLPAAAWAAFVAYQVRSARVLQSAAEEMAGLDALYVHDFQQLGVASAWRGRRVPRVFHLHTPFPARLPVSWADYFVGRLSRYDAVVVSTRRYAENLRRAGLDVPIHVIHPFIDPTEVARTSPRVAADLRARFGIAPDDRIVLHVGRMDPMKGQDRLLRALPRILAAEPRARLLLVGNGSFSSARRGGLGLDKASAWRAQLETLTRDLGIEERVTFAGHLDDVELAAAYDACDVFAFPSTREGFGLAVIEAWQHARPVVVCEAAGVSDLVDGQNGRVVDCGSPSALADAIAGLLGDPEAAAAAGRAGAVTSRAATLAAGGRAIERVITGLLEAPRAFT